MPLTFRHGLITKKVSCSNVEVNAVVDTGAGISVISPALRDRLQLQSSKWEGRFLLLANGQKAHPETCVDLPMLVDGRSIVVQPVVMEINGYDLLLGNDALRQLRRIQIDYRTDEPQMHLGKDDLDVVETPLELEGKIRNRKSRCIPAYSMMSVAVDISTNWASNNRLLEPSAKVMLDKGLSFGRLLIPAESCSSDTINVPLVNFSNKKQWIPKGIVLGTVVAVTTPVVHVDNEAHPGNNIDFDSVINKHLSPQDRAAVRNLLQRYHKCFAESNHELGCSNLVQHHIHTGNHLPIHQAPYPSAYKQRNIIQGQVGDMLNDDVIEPSNSPWAAPVVLVKKPDGSWRFCVDYRKLNSVTTKDVYPLPRIEDALSRMDGSRYFTILDMQSGYWQVAMSEEDRPKTAFVTADGLYHFKVMPFGLTNAPATFQRMMDVLLAGLKWNSCLVYLDDIVVFSKSIEEHLVRLEAVLKCLLSANLKLKLKKCTFLATELKVLGYVVSAGGISPNPDKIAAVQNFPIPLSVRELQSFLGLCSYYRRFIKGFAGLARPLTNLTKSNQPFSWGEEQQHSFEALKERLLTPPILAHPNYELPFEIHTDASGYGVGAILVQRQDNQERVISYVSRLMSSAELNYSVSEKECLALVWAVDKFKTYIWGNKVRILTDHHALCWLLKKRNLAGRLARWSLQLQDMDLEIVHRSGKLHHDADAFSRQQTALPEEETSIPMLLLPSLPNCDVAQAQQLSAWWGPIRLALSESNPTRKTRRLIRHFELKDGVLFRRYLRDGQVLSLLCVPPPLVKDVIVNCHEATTAGHLGEKRTLDKIRLRYFWPKMSKQVIQHVRSCVECQMRKRTLERPAGFLTSINSNRPFERIGIDLIGPFPRSTTMNKHIIVAVDYFTKWVVVKAVPRATTAELVEFFVRKIVLQHGAPTFLISDRGKCFTADFTAKLLKAFETNHLLTTAYHPQCNGQVERFNHTFAQMLAMYVNTYHTNWDEYVDYVAFAYNTSRHESTGMTPFFALYGREAVLPVDVTLGSDPNSGVVESISELTVESIKSRFHNIHEIVRRRMLKAHRRQEKHYNKQRAERVYNVGDAVLVYRPIRKKGRAEKLLFKYHGPFKVVKRLNSLNYVVEPLFGSKRKRDCVHVSKLKTFHGRNTTTSDDTETRIPCYPREESQLQKACGVAPAGLRCLFDGRDRETAGHSTRSRGRATAGLSARPRSSMSHESPIKTGTGPSDSEREIQSTLIGGHRLRARKRAPSYQT